MKYLYWTSRVLTILFIIFISLFALDVFSEGYGFWQAIGAFLIHLIPSYFLIIALIIAWRWQCLGGLIFIGLGVYYIVMTWSQLPQSWLAMAIISGSAFLIGILFWTEKWLKKKKMAV